MLQSLRLDNNLLADDGTRLLGAALCDNGVLVPCDHLPYLPHPTFTPTITHF